MNHNFSHMEISQASYLKNLPYYQQIYDYFKRQIQYGKLLPNQKLPPESQLKDQFKVCRSTIHKALEHSKTMGLLYSIPRKGYYVAGGVPPVILAPLAKPDYPFVRLVPLKPRIPFNAFHRLCRLDVEIPYESEVLRTRFEKAFAGGCHTLLKVEPAAAYMRTLKSRVLSSLKCLHGLQISSSQLTLVQGEYDAYRNVLALLGRGEGRYIIMRSSCNQCLQRMTTDQGFKVKLIHGASEEGFLRQAEVMLRKGIARAICIESRCDYTYGTSLSDQAKECLLSLARRYHIPLIEMDYDRELDGGSFQPLFFKDPGSVIYISCVSKTLDVLFDLKLVLAATDVIASLRHLNESWSLVRERCVRAYAAVLKPEFLVTEVVRMRRDLALTRSVLEEELVQQVDKQVSCFFPVAGASIMFHLPFKVNERLLLTRLQECGICHRQLQSFCTVDMPFKMLKIFFSAMPVWVARKLARTLSQIINESVQCSISRSNEFMYHAAAVQLA